MSSKVQTPLFSKSATVRRVPENHVAIGRTSTTKSRAIAHKSLEEANLRLIQYEIAEREACKAIASMCLDGSKILNIVDTDYEIDDILSGILVLGNLYKRVGCEKSNLDSVIESMRKEYTELELNKNFMIERLENAIIRLQIENNKLQENMTEMKMKHNHKMITALQEINDHQENLESARAEKARLEGRLKLQERKLMEVPRMEEQYQRNARSVIRQQEMANTLKEIGWRKLEDEVKTLTFWKSKAKSLEDIVAQQKAELDNLSSQGRLSLSRYQSLLLSYNSLKRLHPQDDLTLHAVLTGAASTVSATGGTTRGGSRPVSAAPTSGDPLPLAGSFRAETASGKRRPISAPATRLSTSGRYADPAPEHVAAVPASNCTTYNKLGPQSSAASANEDEALDELFHRHGHQSIGYGHKRRPTSAHAGLSRSNNGVAKSAGAATSKTPPRLFNKTLSNIAAEEIEKLKGIIAQKDERIRNLSRKLSHARAYPLMGMGRGCTTTAAGSDEDVMLLSEEAKVSSKGKSGRFDPPGDDESETASFVAEEEVCHQRRVDNALELQKQYNERSAKVRATQPPHIRAIRTARSFAESVTQHLK